MATRMLHYHAIPSLNSGTLGHKFFHCSCSLLVSLLKFSLCDQKAFSETRFNEDQISQCDAVSEVISLAVSTSVVSWSRNLEPVHLLDRICKRPFLSVFLTHYHKFQSFCLPCFLTCYSFYCLICCSLTDDRFSFLSVYFRLSYGI